MRVSTDKNDAGYVELQRIGGIATVLLDGNDISSRCLTADDVSGECICARLRDGEMYMDGDNVATEILRGEVVISVPA